MSGTLVAVVSSAFCGIVGVLVTPLWKWWKRQRAATGSVSRTDARTLWDAQESFRADLLERADGLQGQVDALTKRVDALTDSNDGLRGQVEAAQHLAEKLRREREALTLEVSRLTEANARLERMNAALTAQVAHLTELLERHDIETSK